MCAVEFNYASYGLTKEQWNSLPKDVQEKCKTNSLFAQQIASELKSGGDPSTLGTTLANPSGALKSGPIKGFELERTTADSAITGVKMNVDNMEALKPKYNIADLENDKQLRKTAEAQWEQYFTARYRENPEEAKKDIVRVLYSKDVEKVAGELTKLRDRDSLLINQKYFMEGHATEDEKKLYEKMVDMYTEDYSKRSNLQETRDEYNNEFTLNRKKKDRIGSGETLTEAQIKELAERKALKNFKIGPQRITAMAEDAVYNQHYNKALLINFEYEEKIEKAKADAETAASKNMKKRFALKDLDYQKQIAQKMEEAETPESKRLREEALKADNQLKTDINNAKLQGNDELASQLEAKRAKDKEAAKLAILKALDPEKREEADALVNERMQAIAKFNQEFESTLDPDKMKKVNNLKEKKQKELLKLSKENQEIRAQDLKDIAKMMAEAQVDKQMAEAKFNNTVVHWNKVDVDKKDGKNHTFIEDEDMRKYVEDNAEIFGTEVKEGESADFYGTDKDGKRIAYKFDQDKYKNYMLKLSSDHALDNEFGFDPRYKADFYASMKDRKDLIDKYKDANLPQIDGGDRNLAKKLFEAAGIDVEKDRTLGKRWGHVGLGALKGAASGAAVALVTEYLSTTKIVESKFAAVAQYAGVIPYKKVINYDKVHTVSVDGTVTLTGVKEGDVEYRDKIVVEGNAEAEVAIPYNDQVLITDDIQVGVHVSERIPITVTNTTESWTNGILEGTVIDKETYYHDFDKTYNVPYHYEKYHQVSGIAKGQASIPYRAVVDVNGTVHWVADVELTDNVTLTDDVRIQDQIVVEDELKFEGEEEVTGTTKGRPKLDLNNVLKGGTIGGVSGAVNAAMDWRKIWDDGERQYSILRGTLAEKNVDGRTAVLREPIIVPNENVELLEQDTITLPKTGETEEPKETEVGETEKCKAEAKEDPHKADAYEQVFDMKGKLLYDVIAKAYGITDPKELYEAIGIVKGWHGISQAERSKNIWIANLGLKGSLQLRNGKTFDLTPIKDRNQIDDYTKTDKPGVYRERIPATVESVGGQLVVYCPDSNGDGRVVATYNDYEDARLAAKYYNEHQEVPTPEQLEEMKNPNK